MEEARAPDPSSDEEVARRLYEELNGSGDDHVVLPHEDDAASVALAMALQQEERELSSQRQQQPQVSVEDDAAFAAALAAADEVPVRNAADDESASLALAIQLSEEPTSGAEPVAGRSSQRQAESDALRRHLFTGADGGAYHGTTYGTGARVPAAKPPPPPIVSLGGPSYATVVADAQFPLQQQQQLVRPPVGLAVHDAPRRAQLSAAAPQLSRCGAGPQLIIDGANVAHSYGQGRGFSAEGILRCVAYFADRPTMSAAGGRGLPCSAIAVTLSESRYDPDDDALQQLDAAGVLAWTPVGKDDDVFLLQSAADHNAWVVTNDRWTDHRASRHATQDVRRRVLRYTFVGGAFAPASDDLAKFDARAGA